MKQKNRKKRRRANGRKGPPKGMESVLTPEDVILARRRSLANREEVISFFTRLVFLVVLLWILFGWVFGLTAMQNDDMIPRVSAGDLLCTTAWKIAGSQEMWLSLKKKESSM